MSIESIIPRPSIPLLHVLLPLMAGIVVGEYYFPALGERKNFVYGLVGVLFILVIICFLKYKALYVSFIQRLVLLITTCLVGVCLVVSTVKEVTVIWPTHSIVVRAIVHDITKREVDRKSLRLRIISENYRGSLLQAMVSMSTQKLTIGDEILLRAKVVSLSSFGNPGEMDYAAYLRKQDVVGQVFVNQSDWVLVRNHTTNQSLWESLFTSPLSIGEQLRIQRERLLLQYAKYLSPHACAILAAMSLGEKTLLNSETRNFYSRTGTSHILALSGLHLAILYSLLQPFFLLSFARRSRRLQYVLACSLLILLWTFVFLVGSPISLVRACCMFTLSQLFSLRYRKVDVLHRLLLTILILLLLRPLWLFDVGFQLSCCSVLGIVLITPLFPFPEKWKSVSWKKAFHLQISASTKFERARFFSYKVLWDVFFVSFSAQVATLPLIVYYFHQIPITGLLSNFIAIPMLYILLILVVIFFLLPWAQSYVAFAITEVLSGGEKILGFFADLPYSTIPLFVGVRWCMCCFIVLGCLLYIRERRRHLSKLKIRIGVTILGCVLILFSGVEQKRLSVFLPGTRIYHCWGNTAIHFIAPDGRTWLLCADTLKAKEQLRFTRENDWNPKGWQPQFLSLRTLQETDVSTRLQNEPPLYFAPKLVQFGRQRWAILAQRLSKAFPQAPIRVNYLYLARGCNRSFDHILHYYKPQVVLLGLSLSDYYRKKYIREVNKAGYPIIDCANSPALSFPYQ